MSKSGDSTGNEVDPLCTVEDKQYAYEIKSGATYSSDFFKGISKWAKLSGATPDNVLPFTMVIKI